MEDKVLNDLDDVGALDFNRLDEGTVIKWLQVIADWPTTMPALISLSSLGLTEEDLDIERRLALEKERLLKLERRSVRVNGQLIDPDNLDVSSLAEQFEKAIKASDDLPDLDSFTQAHSPAAKRPHRPSGNGVLVSDLPLNSWIW